MDAVFIHIEPTQSEVKFENLGEQQEFFCPPSKMKLLSFESDTKVRMEGGPVLDPMGCFRGMLIGEAKSGKRLAIKYHIQQTYDLAKFVDFSEDQFSGDQFTDTETWCLKYIAKTN